MELTIEEKELMRIMSELEISQETAIAIGLLLRKRNLGANLLIESLKRLNPKEINDEKIIELALNLE